MDNGQIRGRRCTCTCNSQLSTHSQPVQWPRSCPTLTGVVLSWTPHRPLRTAPHRTALAGRREPSRQHEPQSFLSFFLPYLPPTLIKTGKRGSASMSSPRPSFPPLVALLSLHWRLPLRNRQSIHTCMMPTRIRPSLNALANQTGYPLFFFPTVGMLPCLPEGTHLDDGTREPQPNDKGPST